MVAYTDRHKFLYERHLAAKEKDSTATNANTAPALIALSVLCLTRREPTHWGLRRQFFSHIGVLDGREHCAGSYTDGNFFTRSKIGVKTRQCFTRLPIPPIIVHPAVGRLLGVLACTHSVQVRILSLKLCVTFSRLPRRRALLKLQTYCTIQLYGRIPLEAPSLLASKLATAFPC